MARKGKKKSRAGAANRRGGALANLATTAQNDGELNPHLTERITGSSQAAASPAQAHPPPLAPSYRFNGIFDYHQKNQATGAGWLGKHEIPSTSEILGDPASLVGSADEKIIDLGEELRPNKAIGAYNSNEEYLGTQYELLREDAIRPLREAIRQVQHDPFLYEAEYAQGSGIGIYEPVYITSVIFSPRGLATRVAFSLSRVKKHIRWEQSKRLITGTLVALSPADDVFRTKCVLAVVAARPISALEQNPPEIDLFFGRPEEMEVDPMKKWIMIEARSSFYEASRHTLMALQHMIHEPFPLAEHLVKAEQDVRPPTYLEHNPFMDMSSLVMMEDCAEHQNVDVLRDWPSNASHGLDKSQSSALKRILTKRLAIVQGPPGTGKTYVSVVALRVMLANLRAGDPPIIVTCQTNHALDQLLRHVAEFEPNFIRLGGRSKDKDKIKKRTLFEVRMNTPQDKIPGSLKTRAMNRMRKLTKDMQILLAPLEANKPPVDHRVLLKLGLITTKQAESLEADAQHLMGSMKSPGIEMEQWLGKCLMPCHRPFAPDDFGIEFEEEDFEMEQLKELEAEAIAEDDDIEALKGEKILLCDNHIGKGGVRRTDEEIRKMLAKTPDLTTIPVPERGAIYNYFVRETKRLVLVQYRELAKAYEKAALERRIGQWEQDARLLADQRLIGMTTTGLSKYRALLSSLFPRVVLVEEAAETLEAPVTAALLPTLEHLILVGDHQQLRPHCQVRAFEDQPYNFNLSLFERMVANEVEFDTLARQRRMIPEVRRLLYPIYGEKLKDHLNVKDLSNRPPVEGMGGNNSFFFTHEWPESRDSNMSALNEKEADMVVGVFDYLVLNGIDPEKITILTFYNGQRKQIMKRLRQHPNLHGRSTLHIVTVDSYQGEENDIILLSLVRSNTRHNIGFLSVDNRVCVALSRAKRGFYIFGNAELLACESATWADVVDIMYGKGKGKVDSGQKRRVGYQFPLECTEHGNKTWVEDPSDWTLINGGCTDLCRCKLPCGHTCMLRCHPFDNSRINCTQMCSKRVDACGHPCVAICSDPCRCQICDRHNNGMKSMLKAVPRGGAKPKHRSPTKPTTVPKHVGTSYVPTATRPLLDDVDVESTRATWQAYVNGGAREDDAQYIRKIEEHNAKVLESRSNTIKSNGPSSISTGLVAVSSPSLLIDLDMDSSPSNGGNEMRDDLLD